MKFSYYLLRGGGFLIAQIPLFLLYPLSSFLAWFTRVIVGYRKEVVMLNLKTSFPEKSEKELNEIAKDFYLNFTDIMVESFKMLSLNPELIPSRVKLINPELLNKYKKEGRSILAVSGHYGNWEWMGVGLKAVMDMRSLVTYKPLSSELMDRLMKEIRQLNGSELISMQHTFRSIASSKVPVISLLVADQAPHPENAYWTTFLHQDTPVFMGAERIAKSTGHVVVFLAMRRVKRGYYTLEIQELTENPKAEAEYKITEMHLRALERLIIEQPGNWLWSHKRWKHKRPE
ncbi:MAG: lysophospholipid acyltransferase family protein [Bacteroidota bacterium]